MTIAVSQSGFTDYVGTVANLIDGDATTFWEFGAYDDNTGKTITFDMGGWFDSSTLAELFQLCGGFVGVPVGGFAVRLSVDGVGWYNMPDNTSSFDFGRTGVAAPGGTTSFTPFGASGAPYFRYIQLVGTGGSLTGVERVRQSFNTMTWQDGSGAALTIDTSGGPNPNPPTAPPDDDGSGGGSGSGGTPVPPPPPTPPADSGVTADVNGVSLGLLRTDASAAEVAGVSLGLLRVDNASALVAGVSLGVLMLVKTRVGRSRGCIIG